MLHIPLRPDGNLPLISFASHKQGAVYLSRALASISSCSYVSMGGLLSVVGVVVLLGAGYVLLKVLTNYYGRSPLDNIPGPPSGSWIDGKQNMKMVD